MRSTRNWWQGWPLAAGIAVLVVMLLPLFGVAVFMLRVVLLAALALTLVAGIVALIVSPRFRVWLDLQGHEWFRYGGLTLATDVAVHPAHTWARIDGRRVTVGADDFVAKLLGPVETIELAEMGRIVRQGEPICRLTHGGRAVQLVAPVSGTIVERNERLLSDPELINQEPYRAGWTVRVQAEDLPKEQAVLHRGTEAGRWFQSQVDLLIGSLLSPAPAAAVSLPDGGTLITGLHREIDDQAWERIVRSLFHAASGRA